jgi:hypothetical protein
MTLDTAEHRRMAEGLSAGWQRWGTYLGERSWGTVREDYWAPMAQRGSIVRTITPAAALGYCRLPMLRGSLDPWWLQRIWGRESNFGQNISVRLKSTECLPFANSFMTNAAVAFSCFVNFNDELPPFRGGQRLIICDTRSGRE